MAMMVRQPLNSVSSVVDALRAALTVSPQGAAGSTKGRFRVRRRSSRYSGPKSSGLAFSSRPVYEMTMTISQPIRRRGRPPKVGAGYSATRDALMRAGVIALTEKGFSATGLEEILQSVAVPKGSFYHYFGSKEAFGAELIRSYSEYFVRRLDRFLLDRKSSPLQRVRDFIAESKAGMKRYSFTRGCLVGNLGQEMGALPENFRRQLTTVFEDWQNRTAACLREAQEQGEIAPHLDCDQLAVFFWIGWEGAVLRSKLERSILPLSIFSDGFFQMLRK